MVFASCNGLVALTASGTLWHTLADQRALVVRSQVSPALHSIAHREQARRCVSRHTAGSPIQPTAGLSRTAMPLPSLLLLALLALAAAVHAPGARMDQPHSGIVRPPSHIPEAGLITHLPGYHGHLPSRHYGGYITVNKAANRNLYYYLIESEGDPLSDPVVLWLNGGPGCSSLDGLLYEHGFANIRWADSSQSEPVLDPNPWRWSRAATIMYVDSPAGTGLSFSDNKHDYHGNDTRTAADSEVFLRKFFRRYPHLQHRNFYIAGESYAGIYVPLLVKAVVEGNADGHKPHINIKGYMVGNGCTDDEVDGNAFPPFMVGKSLIPVRLYNDIQRACTGNYWNASADSECASLLADMLKELADVNIYDILGECRHAGDMLPSAKAERIRQLVVQGRGGTWQEKQQPWQEEKEQQEQQQQRQQRRLLGGTEEAQQLKKRHGFSYPLGGGVRTGAVVRNWAQLLGEGLGHDPPCLTSSEAYAWLNSPDVRRALHAAPVSVTGPWTICSDKLRYIHDAGSMIPVHKALVQKHGMRALVYSGDEDACVPHTGSEAWTSGLGLPVEAPWQPWYAQVADGTVQVAGYTVAYEGLVYATVKGAGHMVPQRRPVEALTMFARFVQGKTLHGKKQV